MRTDRGEVFRYDIDDDRWSTIASGTIEGGAPYSMNSMGFTDDGRYLLLDGVGLVDVEAGEAVGTVIPTDTLQWGPHGGTEWTGSGDR